MEEAEVLTGAEEGAEALMGAGVGVEMEVETLTAEGAMR